MLRRYQTLLPKPTLLPSLKSTWNSSVHAILTKAAEANVFHFDMPNAFVDMFAEDDKNSQKTMVEIAERVGIPLLSPDYLPLHDAKAATYHPLCSY